MRRQYLTKNAGVADLYEINTTKGDKHVMVGAFTPEEAEQIAEGLRIPLIEKKS